MEAIALVLAISLAGANAVSRRAEPATPASAVAHALRRPVPMPSSPPRGQDARDISQFDATAEHPGYAVTPQGILATFREAERGYPSRQCDLFDDLIENDAHLRNLFEQREQAVAGKPWVIQAGSQEPDSELAARVLGEALRRLPMIEVLQHLLTFNRYGWAAVEIDWGTMAIDGRIWIVPVWLAPVPARRFRISQRVGGIDELRLYTSTARPDGDELRPGKWVVLRRSGTWVARSALMRTAAWPAMAKRLGFRDWLIYSQRFGLPMPIVKYNEGVVDEGKKVGEEIIRRVGSDGGAVVPDGITLEIVDSTRGSGDNSKAHGGLIAHCNAEMSKLVNGSTLSNDNAGSGGASYALGEVHDTVRWDNVLFDAERVQEGFRTQLFGPFMRFNDLRGASPLLKTQVVRDLDPKVRVELAATLKNELGIDVSISQLRQEVGFREPAGDKDSAPGMPEPVAPAAGGAA